MLSKRLVRLDLTTSVQEIPPLHECIVKLKISILKRTEIQTILSQYFDPELPFVEAVVTFTCKKPQFSLHDYSALDKIFLNVTFANAFLLEELFGILEQN